MGKRNAGISRRTLNLASMLGALVFLSTKKVTRVRTTNTSTGAAHGGGRTSMNQGSPIYSPKRTKVKGHQRNHKGQVVR